MSTVRANRLTTNKGMKAAAKTVSVTAAQNINPRIILIRLPLHQGSGTSSPNKAIEERHSVAACSPCGERDASRLSIAQGAFDGPKREFSPASKHRLRSIKRSPAPAFLRFDPLLGSSGSLSLWHPKYPQESLS